MYNQIDQIRQALQGLRSAPLDGLDYQIQLQQQASNARSANEANGIWDRLPGGPIPDPKWDAWFQAVKNNGVDKFVGGPSPTGSNQLRGQSVQPSYLSQQSTLFAPGQESAVTGETYDQSQLHQRALKGLQRGRF